MKISEILRERERGVSFEFFPPKTPQGMDQLVDLARELEPHGPLYASVTYGAGGSTQERTRETLYRLKEETGLTLMSHLTCVGARREDMDKLLRDYIDHGIDNILALRGDPPHDMYEFDRSAGDFSYARDLVEFIRPYGAFSVGVAVYPEGHPEAPSLEMFFDNAYFYEFMNQARKARIGVPVIPGIMPVTDLAKIKKFASFCGATIPPSLEGKMIHLVEEPEEMFRVGVDFAAAQCRDLLENGVRYLHFYTLNQSRAVRAILDALGM
ncbi:MAG: methylenetetrahydrofolate reductase [Nitrospirota bacterium]